jgi:hypothetical protein
MDEFDRMLASVQRDNSQASKNSNLIDISLLVECCPNCGAPTNNIKCEYCESLIPLKELEVPAANGTPFARADDEIFCHACGELIKATADFCQHCGASQGTQEFVGNYNDDSDNTAATAAGVAAGLVVGAVAKNVASDFLDAFFS